MIAYKIVVSSILVLGLYNQIKTFNQLRGPGASRKVLGAFAVGIAASLALIGWTWVL